MTRTNLRLTIGLLALLSLNGAAAIPTEAPRGVAVRPRHFPEHTAEDVDEAFRLSREVGQHAVFIYQWGALNLDVAKAMVTRSRLAGLVPVLGLSPTTLDQGRKELDLPASVRLQAGPNVSFSNPVVRGAFIKAATELARLKPPYLCLATEINFLAIQRLPEYLAFVSLYKDAYRAVTLLSPPDQGVRHVPVGMGAHPRRQGTRSDRRALQGHQHPAPRARPRRVHDLSFAVSRDAGATAV